jgi:hypothetical protein
MSRVMVGTDTYGNYYAVLNSLQLPPVLQFVIAVEVVYADNTRQWFFTQTYQIEETCAPVDVLYACYGATDNGGYDSNSVYYGLPVQVLQGDPQMRYFHNYTLRGLSALYGGRKNTYTAFRGRPTRTESEVSYNISHEVIPYWYEEVIAEAYARGVVYIGNFKYEIAEYESTPIGDACCERLQCVARAVKTNTTTHGCVFEICVPSTCVLPDVAVMSLSGCKGRTLQTALPVTGTLPIILTVVDAGGFNVAWQDGSISINGLVNNSADIIVELENCGGKVQRTIAVTALCCVPNVMGIVNNFLPSANLGDAYLHEYDIAGTPPFAVSIQSVPSWMTVEVVGDKLRFSGTATTAGVLPVQVTVTNECGQQVLDLTLTINAVSFSDWSCLVPSTGVNTVRVHGAVGANIELRLRANGYFGWNGISGVGARLTVIVNTGTGCASSSGYQSLPISHGVECLSVVTIPAAGYIDVNYQVLVENGQSGANSMVSAGLCATKLNGNVIAEVCQNGACVGTSAG